MVKRGNESKPHIGIYGKCNAGKSTLLNLLLGENQAIVSAQRGTTTDPVKRGFEILDFAPIVAIDTAGLDDDSDLGVERKIKTLETLHHIDLAVLIYCGEWSDADSDILDLIKKSGLDYIIIHNLFESNGQNMKHPDNEVVYDSLLNDECERNRIMDAIKHALPSYSYAMPSMLGDRVQESDVVLLVCPIDSEAPAGRLILPQVQAIRNLLDKKCISVVVQLEQLEDFTQLGVKPKLIITDSQVLAEVKERISFDVEITTFSILLAEMKGDIAVYSRGLESVDGLKSGDKVLILESCLHQTSCEDIGRVKIPKWLNAYIGGELEYDVISGLGALPDDLERYSLVIQCGGCMITPRQLKGRISRVSRRNVPITNYGMLIKKIR